MEVIPSILVKTYEEFEQKVRALEPHVERAHLDIIDGVFAPNKTITGYEELGKIQTSLKFDVHLMVADPYEQMYNWYQNGYADRFIIHAEIQNRISELFDQIKSNGRSAGLALNTETRPEDIENLEELLEKSAFIQFMTVHPGFYGGKYVPEVAYKLRMFREEHPDIEIAVDGGVTPETAKELLQAGATTLVCGSYIWNSDNIEEAINELKML